MCLLDQESHWISQCLLQCVPRHVREIASSQYLYLCFSGVERSTLKINPSHVLRLCRHEREVGSLLIGQCRGAHCPDPLIWSQTPSLTADLRWNETKIHLIIEPDLLTDTRAIWKRPPLSWNCLCREAELWNADALPDSCSSWNSGSPTSCRP